MTLSPTEHDPQHFDLAVVGSGILGLAHAYAAVKRGLKVAVFERTGTPLGASVRNFGMGLVTGQPPGIMLDLARESRAIWLHLAARAHFSARDRLHLHHSRSRGCQRPPPHLHRPTRQLHTHRSLPRMPESPMMTEAIAARTSCAGSTTSA